MGEQGFTGYLFVLLIFIHPLNMSVVGAYFMQPFQSTCVLMIAGAAKASLETSDFVLRSVTYDHNDAVCSAAYPI